METAGPYNTDIRPHGAPRSLKVSYTLHSLYGGRGYHQLISQVRGSTCIMHRYPEIVAAITSHYRGERSIPRDLANEEGPCPIIARLSRLNPLPLSREGFLFPRPTPANSQATTATARLRAGRTIVYVLLHTYNTSNMQNTSMTLVLTFEPLAGKFNQGRWKFCYVLRPVDYKRCCICAKNMLKPMIL